MEKVTQEGWGRVGNERVFFRREVPLWTLNNDGFNIRQRGEGVNYAKD